MMLVQLPWPWGGFVVNPQMNEIVESLAFTCDRASWLCLQARRPELNMISQHFGAITDRW
jgi:hypothetical protein